MNDHILAQGSTVVITHHVRDGKQAEYEEWREEIGGACKTYPGYLDLQLIRPIAGITKNYTIIIRFDNEKHLLAWINGEERKNLIEKARPLLARDVDHYIHSGLDFWFPESSKLKSPKRWKQFLVTWTALVPLNLLLPLAIVPLLSLGGLQNIPLLRVPIISGIAVLLMVYVIMPRYTKLVQRWLYS